MSRDDKKDEVKSRMSQRFQDSSDDSDTADNPDNSDMAGTPAEPETAEDVDTTDDGDTSDEIDPKEEWTGRNVYVPDAESVGPDLLDAFDGEFDRLQYECDWKIRKQTHYYPVLVKYGTERVQDMDGDDFSDRVDELGLR